MKKLDYALMNDLEREIGNGYNSMLEDDRLSFVSGSSVKDGYVGYCSDDGRIKLADYSGRDAPQVVKDGVNLAVYGHEKGHRDNPWKSELRVEADNINSEQGFWERMFKDAIVWAGLKQGRKEARDVARITEYYRRVKDKYTGKVKDIFDEITYWTSELLGMRPEYAYARVEVD